MSKKRVVDLFAGAGGFSLGATWAGCHVEHAIEVDEWACDTLEHNHDGSRVHRARIEQLDDRWIKREIDLYPDLVIGGPPCQGFSHAGRPNKDPKDPRNSLFREFVRFVGILEPRCVVMENVPGILRAKTGAGQPVSEIIVDELQRLGYSVTVAVLDAQHFGVPQARRRVLFMGSVDGAPLPPIYTHGETDLLSELKPVMSVGDAIGDLPLVDVGFVGPTVQYVGPPRNDFQAMMRAGAPSELANHIPMRHSARTVARFAAIAPGQSQSDVGEEHAPRRRVRPESATVATYDQNNRRMYWDRPCHTLAASFYANFVHPHLNRNFTPREGARIQTFPDWYEFKGKPTVVSQKLLAREGRDAERHLCQYNQIGNAVPPLLGMRVVEAVLGKARREAALTEGVVA
jgi:DNA (cytosine-5)-methyltransferase 1